jgi:flagellar hook assembly protein FlgD
MHRTASRASLAALTALVLATPAPSAAVPGSAPAAGRNGTVTLEVRTGAGAATHAVRALAARGLRTAGDLARLGVVSVTVTSADAASTRDSLVASYGAGAVTVSPERHAFFMPNDRNFSPRQALALGTVQAPAAWDTARGDGVTIAVIDGGFDVTHPDLADKVVGAYDVVSRTTSVTDSPSDPLPGHGTAVASVAAASTNNGIGIAGAAPGAKLLLVKAANASGVVTAASLAAGILYATDHGASIISISLGDPTSDAVEAQAIDYATAHNVLVVASAGNEATSVMQYPAAYPGVVAVGATRPDGSARASFSSFGPWVTVAAPGQSIPIALPMKYDTHDDAVDGYSVWDGTSFSAPIVAAEAALVKSLNQSATRAQLLDTITSTATGTDYGFSHGLVQFSRALTVLPRLHPTASATAYAFSPNGDRRLDTTTVRYTLDQTQSAVARVYSSTGSLLLGPTALGTDKPAGTYTWVWNGRDRYGRTARDGRYRIEVRTTSTVATTTVEGVAAANVRVDTVRPLLGQVRAGYVVFFPVRDGYRDAVGLGASTGEALSAYSVVVTTRSGTVVRRLAGGGHGVGRFAATWNGRTSTGTRVPTGTYWFYTVAYDTAGNRSASAKAAVTVSWGPPR